MCVCVRVCLGRRQDRPINFILGHTWTGLNLQLTWLLSVICSLLTKWEWQPIRALTLKVLCNSVSTFDTHTHTHSYVIPLKSSSPVHSLFTTDTMVPRRVHIFANTTLPKHVSLWLHAHQVMPGKYSIKPFVSHFYTAKSIYSMRPEPGLKLSCTNFH